MPDPDYRALLDASIAHLEQLRAAGTRFVPVSRETWENLNQPRATPVPAARPRPAVSTRPSPAAPPARPAAAPTPAPVTPPAGVRAATTGPARPTSLPLEGTGRRPSTPEEKHAALAALRARALACQKCEHLVRSRKNVVFGVGTAAAEIMFVGEAPGADEDLQGEPFVGKAGQLLTKIIQTMGLSRETVYIANILKCRPDTPGQTSGNRKPTPSEMVTCSPYLIEQIQIIQPKVLVALGSTAVEGLMGKLEGITRLRGRWLEYQGVPLMPTYHPAYLLRNQALSEKRKVWEDMLAVLERVGLPITEKQRGFFLKAG